ncbi:MAG TPA: GAF domain-containing protein [Candidatus Sulfotelmatobacter sp.]|nr:GAF domain-containing protein [Candidatus Sulfotelmatobacter sp.]
MSTPLTLDRSYFQTLLASAYVVQQSRLEPDALSSFLEVQSSIRTKGLDAQRAMELIVERARRACQADGTAIALADDDDQLIYRAASGRAIGAIGRSVGVMLFFPAHLDSETHALKIENARNDMRGETAICRQFEAQALLLLPIYKEQKLAGVLQIIYREPHVFADREISAYRLMVSLIEEAMVRAPRLVEPAPQAESAPVAVLPHVIEDHAAARQAVAEMILERQIADKPVAAETMPAKSIAQEPAISPSVLETKIAEVPIVATALFQQPPAAPALPEPITIRVAVPEPSPVEDIKVPVDAEAAPLAPGPSWIDSVRGTLLATWAQSVVVCRAMKVTVKIRRPGTQAAFRVLRRAVPAGIVLGMLGGVSWLDWQLSSIAYGSSPRPVPTEQAAWQGPQMFSAMPEPAAKPAPVLTTNVREPELPSAVSRNASHKSHAKGLKKVRVGPDEVDYVSDDVTMRVFKPAGPPKKQDRARQIRVGDDVTIRTFPTSGPGSLNLPEGGLRGSK